MADFSTPDLGISIALANIGAYQGQLARARAATDRAMGGVEQATSRATASFQKLSSEVPLLGRAFELARNPVVALGAALVGTIAVFGNAINTARQFESQLASTAAIAQVERTSEAFKSLNDEAQRLGTTTEFSATQAAQAMEFLARAGFNTNEILQATESTLALATVGNLELARSADIASNVLAQFNKDASDLPSVVDAIAKTTVTANTNVEQFAEAMKYLGPTAAAMGVSIEEASATIGILSNSGLQGSLATRALGTSLTRLAAPTEKAAAEMERLGIQAFDAEGNFVGIAGVISNLEDSFAGLTQEQRQGALATIFGAEAIQEYNILLSAGSKAIEDYTKEIQSASAQNGKFAQSVREAKLDTFQGAIISLKSAWEGFQIAIAQGALPVLKEVTFGIAGFVRGATAMVQVLKDNADLLLILVPAIATYNSTTIAAAASSLYQATAERAKAASQAISAALTTRFIGLQAAYITVTNLLIGRITAATAAQQLWNIAVSANPLGLILAGVTAAAAAFVIYRRSVESTSKVLRDQLGKARSEIIDSYTKERAELDTVFKALASDSTAREEKAKLIDRVNSKYGDLLENQITEKSSLEDLKKAHDQLSASILNQLVTEAKAKTAQALFNSIIEATNKKIQVQAGYVKENTGWWERLQASFVVAANSSNKVLSSAESMNKALGNVVAEDAQKQIDQYKGELDGLSARFGEIQKALQEQFKGIDFTELFQGFEDGLKNLNLGEAAAGSLKALEDRLSSLQDKLNQSAPDAKLFADIQKQIQAVSQEIERVKRLQVKVQVEKLDLTTVDQQIKGLKEKAKGILGELDKIEIRPGLDAAGIIEEAKMVAAQIEVLKAVNIRVGIDPSGIDSALSDLEGKLADLKATFAVTTDPGELETLQQKIREVESQIKTIKDVRVSVQLSGTGSIETEIGKLEDRLSGLQAVQVEASLKDNLTSQLQSVQEEIERTNRLKVAIQSEGIGAIDKEIGAAQAKLLSLTRQLQAAPDNTVFSQISGQIKDTRQEIDRLNRFRVEISSESVEALTSRVNVLKSALGSLAPDSGQFRAINEEIRKLDERIAQARIFQVQVSGDKSIDALSEQLRILKERINQVQPDPEVLTPMILKIQELEREIQKANRLKIQIEAGVTVSLPEIAAATIDVPAISIPVKIDDSAAGHLAKLVTEAGKLTAQPLDSMAEAARKLGLDMQFVSSNFSTYQALQAAATSGAYMFAQSLGATSQQALEFAVGLQVLGEEIQRQIVGGAVRAFEAFGAELAKSITQGNSAISAFEALFKGLVRVILVDVPKLIGTFLIQTGIGLAFPTGIPFVVAGAALVGLSGLIGGLLDASANKQEASLPDTSGAVADGFGRASGPVALGLSSYNPASREQQIVVQPSFYVESDGILREIEIRQIIRNENLRGG